MESLPGWSQAQARAVVMPSDMTRLDLLSGVSAKAGTRQWVPRGRAGVTAPLWPVRRLQGSAVLFYAYQVDRSDVGAKVIAYDDGAGYFSWDTGPPRFRGNRLFL